jgi:hypothetical protein
MNYKKVIDKETGTLTFPPDWRDDPEGEWLKWVEPELRQQGGAPAKLMASALQRMPEDHPQREEVQRVYDSIVELQMAEIKKQMNKNVKAAQQVGMTLEVNNLKTASQYNGRKVLLCEWVNEKGRWKCKLDDGEYIGVNPRNLY